MTGWQTPESRPATETHRRAFTERQKNDDQGRLLVGVRIQCLYPDAAEKLRHQSTFQTIKRDESEGGGHLPKQAADL
jgi:hypothetical protein